MYIPTVSFGAINSEEAFYNKCEIDQFLDVLIIFYELCKVIKDHFNQIITYKPFVSFATTTKIE